MSRLSTTNTRTRRNSAILALSISLLALAACAHESPTAPVGAAANSSAVRAVVPCAGAIVASSRRSVVDVADASLDAAARTSATSPCGLRPKVGTVLTTAYQPR